MALLQTGGEHPTCNFLFRLCEADTRLAQLTGIDWGIADGVSRGLDFPTRLWARLRQALVLLGCNLLKITTCQFDRVPEPAALGTACFTQVTGDQSIAAASVPYTFC